VLVRIRVASPRPRAHRGTRTRILPRIHTPSPSPSPLHAFIHLSVLFKQAIKQSIFINQAIKQSIKPTSCQAAIKQAINQVQFKQSINQSIKFNSIKQSIKNTSININQSSNPFPSMSTTSNSYSYHSDRLSSRRLVELQDSYESFRAWKPLIRSHLNGKNLLELIEPHSPAVSGDSDSGSGSSVSVADSNSKKKKKKESTDASAAAASTQPSADLLKRKREAHAIVFRSLHPSLLQLFEDESEYPFDDPCKLWSSLLSHFQIASLSNKNHLRTQLYQARMKSSESVDSYVARIQQLSRSLKSIDAKWNPDDVEVCFFLLNGLPESFKTIKLLIEHDGELKFNQVVNKLRQFQESESWTAHKQATESESDLDDDFKRTSIRDHDTDEESDGDAVNYLIYRHQDSIASRSQASNHKSHGNKQARANHS
jgi:hypothetical protein